MEDKKTNRTFLFILTITTFIAGSLLILTTYINWSHYSIFEVTIFIFYFSFIAIVIFFLLLSCFKNNTFIKLSLRFLKCLLFIYYFLGLYGISILLPLLAFMLTNLFLFGLWFLLKELVGFNLTGNALLYLTLTFSTTVFSLYGYKIIIYFVKFIDNKYLSMKLIPAIQPHFIRGYIYILFVLSLLLVYLESFSYIFINWNLWFNYKDVILAVFITFIAIDRAFYFWKDTIKNTHI